MATNTHTNKNQQEVSGASNLSTAVDVDSTGHDIFTTGETHVETASSRQVDLSVGNVENSVEKTFTATPADDAKDHKLVDVFSAWNILGQTTWTSSAPKMTTMQHEISRNILDFNLPQAVFADDLVNRKLAHHRYVVTDVEVEVKVNALPTQSGLLFVTLLPLLARDSSDCRLVRGEEYTGYPSITALNGVYLNIEDSTSVRLTVPFRHPLSMFDMINNPDQQPKQTLGTLIVYTVCPLLGPTTSETCDVTVFARLVNTRLFGPTENPNPIVYPNTELSVEDRLDGMEDQIGAAEDSGWRVSDIAGAVSNASGALASVPVIGSVAGAVSWFSRMVSKGAAALGFSTPLQQTAPNLVVPLPNYGAQHVQCHVPGLSLGAVQDNEVKNVLEGEDEMDITTLCRKDCVIETFEMSLDSADNVLGKHWSVTYVGPIPHQIVETTTGQISHTPMSYVAQFFKYWRGTLVYKFRFIKTKFHKGRVRITFEPGKFELTADVPNYNRCYSTLVDLASQSEVTFEVPYLCNRAWLETALTKRNNVIAWTDRNVTGRVTLSVVNPLIGPDSVSRNISVVVSVSSPDMVFAMPDMVYAGNPNQTAPALTDEEDPALINQENEIGETPNPISISPHVEVLTKTMGEHIGSLRLLAKKMSTRSGFSYSWNDTTAGKIHHTLITHKWVAQSAIGRMYALYRGSMRFSYPSDYSAQLIRSSEESTDMHYVTMVPANTQCVIPFYSDMEFQLVSPRNSMGTTVTERTDKNGIHIVADLRPWTLLRRPMIGGGDDFTFAVLKPIGLGEVKAIVG